MTPPLTTEAKRAQLAALFQQKGAAPQVAPTSFAQRRLWFLDQYEPDSPGYLIFRAYRLRGPLDEAALEAALNGLVARHAALRTTFTLVEGQPKQIIRPTLTLPLARHDLRPLNPALREAEARRQAEAEALRPFDLARGPLLRAQLLHLDADDHVLLLTMHHIVSDGWSMGILARELAALYAAQREGRAPALPPLTVQYPDLARQQLQRLEQAGALDAALAYWQQQLTAPLPVLELPTDRPRPAAQSIRGATYPLHLPAALRNELVSLSHQEGVTLFMTLLAAFQLWLHRLSGQDDLLVGTPVAGRTHRDSEPLIGLFVNTLVLRASFADRPSFRTLLRRTRETTLDAFAHQDLPFEKLVEALAPQRDLSHSPLFQAMFALQNAASEQLTLAGLVVERLPIPRHIAAFDLSLLLEESDEGLRGLLEYSTDLFEASTIARLAGHFLTLLHAIVADPACPVATLPLLTEAERQQLLVTWNRPVPAPAPVCLHVPIERQAAATPDTVALIWGSRTLTYRALNEQANQLARHLRALGVGPERTVGLYLDSSPELIVGLLATLKAGGTYLPLDPAYPTERIAFMLDDARATVLLTRAEFLPTLPPHPAPTLCLDWDAPLWSHHAAHDLSDPIPPETLAYLIYTSGSTGRPKGVAVPHTAATPHFAMIVEEWGLTRDDRVLQFASPNFDISLEQILCTLYVGATLVLRDSDWSLAEFWYKIREQGITVADLPTAFWHHLVADAATATPFSGAASLRLFTVGGEALLPEPVRQWHDLADGTVPVLNVYGPTESVVTATSYEVTPARLAAHPTRYVPIGGPLVGYTFYILDRSGQPVPIGVPGELYIGGPMLARGYLGRPALTAEKFTPDPFSPEPGSRLYRTGDLTRWLPDGIVEFLGRLDTQVKIRGFRIELGEIEATLAQHPTVSECVVEPRDLTPGSPSLVAYVVPHVGQPIDTAALHDFLAQRLPEYMLPATFVQLETLPFTPNGKVERRALPTPLRPTATDAQEPTSPLAMLVAAIWGEVLGLERVAAQANFFALGGHSLLATQVIARVRATFAVELPLRDLFEAPTLAAFAARVEAVRQGEALPPLPPLHPEPARECWPLSFAQQRLWFLEQYEPDSPLFLMPLAYHLRGPLDEAALQAALDALVARHATLRTAFTLVEGQPVQVVAPSSSIPLLRHDLTSLSATERAAAVRHLTESEAEQPFDLSHAPLLRARLLHLGPDDHHLLLTLHHIIADGWSTDLLLRDLLALYAAQHSATEPALPPLTVQYPDFAIWQRRCLDEAGQLERHLAFWQRHLGNELPVLELPTDHPRPAVQSHHGAEHTLAMPVALREALVALSRQESVTLFMTLLAAFQLWLHRLSGQDDLVVGTPIAGRTHRDSEPLIGLFVNTLVLRASFADGPSFRTLLRRTRETTLDAFAHQELPFEKLVEALTPQRDLSHSPLFQVMFALQQATPAPRPLPDGLVIEPLEPERHTTKYDLSLTIQEQDAGLSAHFTYNRDLFEAATIARFAGNFLTLLHAITADPVQPVASLPLLTEAERQQLLVAWNPPRHPRLPDASLPTLWAAQVARTPDAIALDDGSQSWCYRELDERSLRLAHHLRALGIGLESRVGLHLTRSADLIVAMLATLRVGGTYVPLDPTYPSERLALMLDDAAVTLLLTEADHAPPPGYQGRTVVLPALWPELLAQPTPPLAEAPPPDALVYIMYTSGSTGQPKGIGIPHRAVARLVCETDYLPFGPDLCFLQLAPVTFDASTLEIWGSLLHGARLVLFPGSHPTLAEVADEIARSGVTTLWLTAGLFHQMAEHHLDALRPLRHLLAGGDVLASSSVERVLDHLPHCTFINGYGPTENTTFTTCHTLRGSQRFPGSVPIGRPISHTQVYILDRHAQPVPVGVVGELYTGGDGLARGYLNRPALTAAKFVPDPFSGELGARLYRTGDLARWLPDGTIEFLGRTDSQIKLRGFRIEPGEIEATLDHHPAIAEAVVVVRDLAPGSPALVAYVVPHDGERIEPSDLRAFLADRLPAYMVPAAFVPLDTLPLTPNGKIERRALPNPARALDTIPLPPVTDTERHLATIWSEILGVEFVGQSSHFFELGGHSLLATQVLARIRATFALDLPLRALFEAPTLAALAARVDAAATNAEDPLLDQLLTDLADLSPDELARLLGE